MATNILDLLTERQVLVSPTVTLNGRRTVCDSTLSRFLCYKLLSLSAELSWITVFVQGDEFQTRRLFNYTHGHSSLVERLGYACQLEVSE